MMCMYYSIVHTHHIHRSDMYIHFYARWVGFQMTACCCSLSLSAAGGPPGVIGISKSSYYYDTIIRYYISVIMCYNVL